MRAVSTAAAGAKHALGATAQAFLILAIIAMLVIAVSMVTNTRPAGAVGVLAGRGHTASASITVSDTVFGGSTTARTDPGMWVKVDCYQDGRWVYGQYKQADSSGDAVLGWFGPTPNWSGGSANCTAQEGSWSRNGRWRGGASTDFFVSG